MTLLCHVRFVLHTQTTLERVHNTTYLCMHSKFSSASQYLLCRCIIAEVQWLCRSWVASPLCPRNSWFLCWPVYLLAEYMGQHVKKCLSVKIKKKNKLKSTYWNWCERQKRTFLWKSQHTVALDMSTKSLNILQPWKSCLINASTMFGACGSEGWDLKRRHFSGRNSLSRVKTSHPSLRSNLMA